MTVLLDSQAALWLLNDSDKLGKRARKLIESASVVSASAATVWELTIKAMLGKMDVPADLPALLGEAGVELLSVTAEHAESLRAFPELSRHDPFDRLIVAQAYVENLPLLTADRVLLKLDRDFIIDASE